MERVEFLKGPAGMLYGQTSPGGLFNYVTKKPEQAFASLDWMSNNLDASQTGDTLAARAGLTPRTFARRFREQTGTTPLQWLVTAHIQRAQELLEESETSIDQTALLAGFESPVTFRARFRRAVGLTPSEYRRRLTAVAAAE